MRDLVFGADPGVVPEVVVSAMHVDPVGEGFGRAESDLSGRFAFDTVKPGRVAGPNGTMQAPHLLVAIHMRGILSHLFTRIYFSDEASNADDPILALVPAERRDTIIAARDPSSAIYRIDFRIQGTRETVFFDL